MSNIYIVLESKGTTFSLLLQETTEKLFCYLFICPCPRHSNFNTFLYKIIPEKLAYIGFFSYLCIGFRNEPNTMKNT